MNLFYRMILKIDQLGFVHFKDTLILKAKYKVLMGKKLKLKNPKKFNEKLQWLKLNDRNPEYIQMVDKYEVKKYIEKTIGKKYIIDTLGVWEKFDDINFDSLPNQFVLKCTHDSGGIIICTDKKKFDFNDAKKKINKSLNINYYYNSREWPYKNVKPRIIIEKYMIDEEGQELKDYKLFCFNGLPKIILVCSNRNGSYKNTDFYDTEWNLMPFTREKHENSKKEIKKPRGLNEMLEIAKKISKDIPFVRVDLYEIKGKVYFGEMTFFPSAGFEGFNPEEYDRILGDMLELPNEKIEGKNEK